MSMKNTEKTGWAPTIVETNLNLRGNGIPDHAMIVAKLQVR